MRKTAIAFILLVSTTTVLDYANIPSLLGLHVSNMNWSFYTGFLNAVAVLAVFAITYKVLTGREVEIREKELRREENKQKVSLLLLNDCYEDCKRYIDLLNEENVNNYIVPKIDFDSTDLGIAVNFSTAPFVNQDAIADFAKDGQIPEDRIARYYAIKRKFEEYVNMRITLFDAPHFYVPLRGGLLRLLNDEIACIDRLKAGR
ncbi:MULTISPECIES: hypothetical protein [Gordonibacter]|uniref:Uncharacterized protein n=1 Tax=Gordonibacter faecis TaxID=3047475 RepID=A0ABT7DTD2_9ACTN|nr:hypothetical protein [Gordonibacter sp. KGMB12511]MDJ1651796.1 hypothetical protein [Gordonibacter sp. KGMB12511]HIW75670.1 hypothetical protein [Candidatus Gordonibacter avicola]